MTHRAADARRRCAAAAEPRTATAPERNDGVFATATFQPSPRPGSRRAPAGGRAGAAAAITSPT